MSSTVHAVDERLPTGKLAALGLQHVLIMFAGAVAVPLLAPNFKQWMPHSLH